MHRNNNRCDTIVKDATKNLHSKCCKDRRSHQVLGRHLNLLPEIVYVFDAEKHYQVCRQLCQQKIIHIIPNKINDNHTNVNENTDLNEPPPDDVPVADPSPQQSNGNESNVDHNSGLNEPSPIIVPVAGPPPPHVNENESNTDQSDDLNEHHSDNLTVALHPLHKVNDNESNADLNNYLHELPSNNIPVVNPAPQDLNEDQNEADPDQQSTCVTCWGFTTNFPTNTLKACNTDGRRKSFMDLTIRDRRKRVIMASQNILASNVCPKPLEKDGMDYLKNNISLAKDVSAYLDAIKFLLFKM